MIEFNWLILLIPVIDIIFAAGSFHRKVSDDINLIKDDIKSINKKLNDIGERKVSTIN
ncbi:MAG: hypothetical protein L6244_04125 [Candidatus Methanoperedenaceae archaeon]|nr:hypothetical protein [Euryarchaeota archaeon]MCG2727818.1 hypothetical protein [Candidatus Methanoperedenaceae archaeon]